MFNASMATRKQSVSQPSLLGLPGQDPGTEDEETGDPRFQSNSPNRNPDGKFRNKKTVKQEQKTLFGEVARETSVW
jgi:hypothetical protein